MNSDYYISLQLQDVIKEGMERNEVTAALANRELVFFVVRH